MNQLKSLLDIFLHVDKHLAQLVSQYGTSTYLILFLIVFCETGLVVTPFLPGDSLLFAAGALVATHVLDFKTVALALFAAAVLGDAVNYAIGHFLGPRAFKQGEGGFLHRHVLKREYLERTEQFYAKYGGKAVIIARFVPIVRTFAPFLAGVGTMTYRRFAIYNMIGALLWVSIAVGAGYFFGSVPIVQRNFELVILAIIALSLLPILLEWIKARAAAKRAASAS